jgi:hypothetical protein
MGAIDLPKSPHVFQPEQPGAADLRNALTYEYRDQQAEVKQLLNEETGKVIHHLKTKLPREVLERLDAAGGLKEKLYTYFSRNFHTLFNRYIETTEDETVKKIRKYVDKEVMNVLARYSPQEVADLLGGADTFSTGGIEKPVVRRNAGGPENPIDSQLRGENACSIVKRTFRDNPVKPKTVTDVKFSVNIPDSELTSPVFHYQATAEYLIRDLLSRHFIDTVDNAIGKLKDGGIDHALAAGAILERLTNLRAEIDPADYGQLNARENLENSIGIESIRTQGFNTAINSITSMLERSGLGYQYIENFKNARELLIREYEETDPGQLPDERYELRMRYYDNAKLVEERKAYDVQIKSFELEVLHLWDMLEVTCEDAKSPLKVTDYQDLAGKQKNRIRVIKEKAGEPLYEDIAKVWDEISFVRAAETETERMHRTYLYEKDHIRQKIVLMRERMQSMYDNQYPAERRVMEDRLNFLEKEYFRFDNLINPYHLEPGLLLDVDITSIKRKKSTLDAMANVLNEFLNGVSRGFADAAFASFSRRRPTVREDRSRSGDTPTAPVSAPAAPKKARVADAKPAKRGGGRKATGRRPRDEQEPETSH